MLLLQFVVLQLADCMSTLAFLRSGVAEANPLVRAALALSTQPAVALAFSKAFGIALALAAWRSGRFQLLRKVNLVFAVCVVWNLVALALGPGSNAAG